VTDPDLVRLFIEPLEGLGLVYMITGGVASVIYGDPRFTRDIDIVLELHGTDARRLADAYSGFDYYVPPLDVIIEESARGGHFNIIDRDTGLRADIYLAGNDPLHAWAFERRRRVPLEGWSIWVAPIEYVILRKLQYYQISGSDRHLRDVAMMLQLSGESIDGQQLTAWLDRLDLHAAMAATGRYED
jgi:hypothetical protein